MGVAQAEHVVLVRINVPGTPATGCVKRATVQRVLASTKTMEPVAGRALRVKTGHVKKI